MTSPFNIFQQLAEAGQVHGIHLLVIGGHAVNAHGYQRTTIDADFLVREEDVPQWRLVLEGSGYKWQGQSPSFIRFEPSVNQPDGFPVDLMLVNDETFQKLYQEKQVVTYGGTTLSVPKPMHLIALKLHAMRNVKRARGGKDLADILGLIQVCQIASDDIELHSILHRYATPETRDEIQRKLQGV
jgi:hypothetical protein